MTYEMYISLQKDKGKDRPKIDQEVPDGKRSYHYILSIISALAGAGCLTPRSGRFTLAKEAQ
jgi:hypothetical protein